MHEFASAPGGYLNTCGELNSSLHRYAVHSVEHNSKVISGGHEHPWQHCASQAKHPTLFSGLDCVFAPARRLMASASACITRDMRQYPIA